MKPFFLTITAILILSLAACGGSGNTAPTVSADINTVIPTPEPAPIETEAPEPTPIETETPEETPEPSELPAPAVLSVDAVDANLHDTKENPVPLGQWVGYPDYNYTSKKNEPLHIRIIRVSRDSAEVQAAIDGYNGFMDFTLSEDNARDIEYGIVEFEIFFAPDYPTREYGISVPSVTLSTRPFSTSGFRTDSGTTYVGLGVTYGLSIERPNDKVYPGDIVRNKNLFSVLKDYDETEYGFSISWYDGEVKSENERQVYFAVVEQ